MPVFNIMRWPVPSWFLEKPRGYTTLLCCFSRSGGCSARGPARRVAHPQAALLTARARVCARVWDHVGSEAYSDNMRECPNACMRDACALVGGVRKGSDSNVDLWGRNS